MRRFLCLCLVCAAATACGESHSTGDASVGPDPALFACVGPEECIVVPESCCGSCGAATRGDAIAVRVDRASEYRTEACGGGVSACPGCYMAPDPTLVAGCDAGRCVVVDLHEHASAACASDDECVVRTRDCCECGGDTSREGLIAVHRDRRSDFAAVVCDADTGCPECAPVYPPEAVPACNPAGYCEVVWASP